MSAAGYDFKVAGEAIWKVLVASVLIGGGLPVLFAGGIRALAWGEGGSAEADSTARANPLGRVIAVVIFAAVVYVIAAGIVYVIATGKGSNYDISFANFIPEIKKTH